MGWPCSPWVRIYSRLLCFCARDRERCDDEMRSITDAGLFMAQQEKIIACGVGLSMYGMCLRFVCGPLITGVSALALGLRSDILAIVIIQVKQASSTCLEIIIIIYYFIFFKLTHI